MGYNGHTICRVYLKDQKKVIWEKDLHIFEDYGSKSSTKLPDYNEGTPTFQGFLFTDNDDEQIEEGMYLTHTSDQKVLDAEKIDQPLLKEELHLTCING